MGAGQVAGSVRARAVAGRCVGRAVARSVASQPDLARALRELGGTGYRRVARAGGGLPGAEAELAGTVLWRLRVLAGWQSAAGAQALRVLAGGFELANVDGLVARLAGRPAPEPYQLGALSTAWSRLAGAGTLAALRDRLAASTWGDPGDATAAAIAVGTRLSWAARVAELPELRPWAAGGAALLVAREVLVAGRPLPPPARARAARLLGPAAGATRWSDYVAALHPAARWALSATTGPDDLWRAEAAWWARIDRDGAALLARSGFDLTAALGCAAVLAADAWRLRAALEAAARGGRTEAFDALT